MANGTQTDLIKELALGADQSVAGFTPTFTERIGRAPTSEEVGLFVQESSLFGPRDGVTADPVGAQPEVDIPSVDSSTQGIVGGTERIRGQQRENEFDANQILTDTFAKQDEVLAGFQTRQNEIAALAEEARQLTQSDFTAIAARGAEAGREFDPLISEAREEKRQGLARAVVGAGEKGGFLSTQFAGQAALTPIEGGGFVGAGGELSKIKGKLDQNIFRLETAKISAISAAKVAAEKAIRTRKKEDLTVARNIFKDAQDLFKLQSDVAQKRIDLIAFVEDRERTQIEFAQEQEDRIAGNLAPNMVFIDENGSVSSATNEEIKRIADENGIDPIVLANMIQERVIELEGIEQDKREEALAKQKTEAGIDATRALTEQRRVSAEETERLLPLKEQKLQADIQKSLRSGSTANTGVSASTAADLLASRGSDGFVNTEKYSQAFDEAVLSGPKAVSNFKKQFPAQTFLNPDDPTAIRFIQTQSQALQSDDFEDIISSAVSAAVSAAQ